MLPCQNLWANDLFHHKYCEKLQLETGSLIGILKYWFVKNPSLTGFCKIPTNPLTNRLGLFFIAQVGRWPSTDTMNQGGGTESGGRLRYFNSGLFGEFGSPAVHTKRSIWGSETFKQKRLIYHHHWKILFWIQFGEL